MDKNMNKYEAKFTMRQWL